MKTMRWIARIWSIPLILYALVVLLGTLGTWLGLASPDPYAVEQPTLAESLPPALLGLSGLGLALAWRWEKLGSLVALALLAGALGSLLFRVPLGGLSWRTSVPYWMCLVALVPGILFLVSGLRTSTEGSGASTA